jgi:hypothetical protein
MEGESLAMILGKSDGAACINALSFYFLDFYGQGR